MLLDSLHQQKSQIEALVHQHGAGHIRVFGSVARGEETEESDIDLLVELPKGYDLFTQRMRLVESLESLLGRRVDLIPEHELNPHIRSIVIQEAKAL